MKNELEILNQRITLLENWYLDRMYMQSAVRKWERIVAGEQGDRGTTDCPLCGKYYTPGVTWRCTGCPVYKTTLHPGCGATPYQDWKHHRATNTGRPLRWYEFYSRHLAKRELEFLRNLLIRQPMEGRASTG